MKIKYRTSVRVAAGWRDITVTATAEAISAKMVKVTAVDLINGEEVKGTMSRTGASRQQFWGVGVARAQIGQIKRLSACTVEEVAA